MPGELLLNKNEKFTCKQINCLTTYKSNLNIEEYNTNLYIANSYGRYCISDYDYQNLNNNNQIFLRYNETVDEVDSYQKCGWSL